MSVWAVAPETVKYDLVYVAPDGQHYPFWITVKKFLTIGEQRRVLTAGWRGMSNVQNDEGKTKTEIEVDWRAQTFTRTAIYLTSWSLDSDLGAPSQKAIETLTPEVFDVIEGAINAHVTAMAEEKKVLTGSASPSATSA